MSVVSWLVPVVAGLMSVVSWLAPVVAGLMSVISWLVPVVAGLMSVSIVSWLVPVVAGWLYQICEISLLLSDPGEVTVVIAYHTSKGAYEIFFCC